MNKTMTLMVLVTVFLGLAFEFHASAQSFGYINGHEYIDLGLSVKWATCNVGAIYPSEYGSYFAWGEIKPKSLYLIDNSVTFGKLIDWDIAGDERSDAARANWGGTWRLPTDDEIKELCDKCKWLWTKQGNHYGYVVVGPNGSSIFLPAAGFKINEATQAYDITEPGRSGYYWSSIPHTQATDIAVSLDFLELLENGNFYVSPNFTRRERGLSIRPVSN